MWQSLSTKTDHEKIRHESAMGRDMWLQLDSNQPPPDAKLIDSELHETIESRAQMIVRPHTEITKRGRHTHSRTSSARSWELYNSTDKTRTPKHLSDAVQERHYCDAVRDGKSNQSITKLILIAGIIDFVSCQWTLQMILVLLWCVLDTDYSVRAFIRQLNAPPPESPAPRRIDGSASARSRRQSTRAAMILTQK